MSTHGNSGLNEIRSGWNSAIAAGERGGSFGGGLDASRSAGHQMGGRSGGSVAGLEPSLAARALIARLDPQQRW